MQAMLIEDDPAIRAASAAALSRAGFAVTVAGSVDAAKAAVRRGIVDVLVMAERVGGRLAHDVALLAELRNPGLGTILLSDRAADETDEIFALLPSLHAVLGRSTPPRMLTDLALAAARWQGHEAPAAPPAAPVQVHEAPSFQAVAPAAPVEASEAAGPVAALPDLPALQPSAPDPAPIDLAPIDPASLATAAPVPASSDRAMPPPVPAPSRVPSFLRMAGLVAPAVEAPPAPPVAPLPQRRARRLHLA